MITSYYIEEDHSLKLALGQPWVWSVGDFIFLAMAYEGGWLVLSLTVSSSHWQCAVSVLIIAELARGAGGTNFCPGRDLNPEPHGWRSSTLTTGLPRNPSYYISGIYLTAWSFHKIWLFHNILSDWYVECSEGHASNWTLIIWSSAIIIWKPALAAQY